ncbi:MAG: hypothetical protein EOO50_10160 [Flavobacterium sp.]|uniref:hypothetical protein n=1 Tax=Flavobacterium sp. TaxID=239 RepID=UPI00121AEC2A|nr:hypothetical protein [Flavobacterium sp.]RZJ66286.1 MAG: hypothetical protein EOO50_10160 [Flavobacterium sp.]
MKAILFTLAMLFGWTAMSAQVDTLVTKTTGQNAQPERTSKSEKLKEDSVANIKKIKSNAALRSSKKSRVTVKRDTTSSSTLDEPGTNFNSENTKRIKQPQNPMPAKSPEN